MAERTERVYRATAHYADGTVVRRRFLTKHSRDAWAGRRREGYPADEFLSGMDPDAGLRPAIPPATRVDVEDSGPILWPDEIHRAHPRHAALAAMHEQEAAGQLPIDPSPLPQVPAIAGTA